MTDSSDIRKGVASEVYNTLNSNSFEGLSTLRLFKPYYSVGPFGGEQEVVLAAYEDKETGEVHGVLIAVYSDQRSLERIEERFAEVQRNQELKDRLSEGT
jgi:hypothetical protein